MNHYNMLHPLRMTPPQSRELSRPVIARARHAKAYLYRDAARKRPSFRDGRSNLREDAGFGVVIEEKGSKKGV